MFSAVDGRTGEQWRQDRRVEASRHVCLVIYFSIHRLTFPFQLSLCRGDDNYLRWRMGGRESGGAKTISTCPEGQMGDNNERMGLQRMQGTSGDVNEWLSFGRN